jgi:uncharacterized membrane protein YqiK
MDWYQLLVGVGIALVAILVLFFSGKALLGLVIIGEKEVGIVIKKFGGKSLPDGKLIALNGEAGYQADTLSPGLYFGYWPWQYEVEKESLTEISSGEIGLIVAKDGAQIPSERILGKVVECNNFQSARAFLLGGGQKGRQTGILTAGFYRINPALFDVVTKNDAEKYDLNEEDLVVFNIAPDGVGVVTTLDGKPISGGEIAGPATEGHNNFQDPQSFINNGGSRGLQEQVLLSGNWSLNPWFVKVSVNKMTEIPVGHVGVVMSYVGKAHVDISGDEFKHGDLVERGHKGIWEETLSPGKYPINPITTKVEIVPTTNIALNWATNRSESHKLDEKLSSIKVRSKDGFSFVLDVTQIIHISAKKASRVISRFGSVSKLVDQVLEPAIGSYFRESSQSCTVLDFLDARKERREAALKFIRAELADCDVEAVNTYIGDLVPPESLMQTLTDRKIAEEQKSTYAIQEEAQKQRQTLKKEEALADIQSKMVEKEQNIRMQEYEAQASIKRAEGEAKSAINRAEGESQSAIKRAEGEAKAIELKAKVESEAARLKGIGEASAIEAVGRAKAAAYEAGVKAMGQDVFGKIQIVQLIGEKNIRLTPDFLVTGGGTSDNSSLLLQGMVAKSLVEKK